MSKPIMLLDVDGVLNCFTEENNKNLTIIDKCSFAPVPVTRPFLNWAWENFEVYWLTAWLKSANFISDWAGIPHKEYIDDPGGMAWKLAGVIKKFGDGKGREFVWIEDGCGDEARAWMKERDNFHYVHTDPFIGLTQKHVEDVSKLFGIPLKKDWHKG